MYLHLDTAGAGAAERLSRYKLGATITKPVALEHLLKFAEEALEEIVIFAAIIKGRALLLTPEERFKLAEGVVVLFLPLLALPLALLDAYIRVMADTVVFLA